MLKKTVSYKDYNGKERTDELYFNLDEGELMEMEMSVNGGYTTMIERVVKEEDNVKLFQIFKEFVVKSYGEKSADGKYFIKEDENGRPLVRKFLQSKAYSALMMEFMSKTESFTEFVNGIIPAEMVEKAKEANRQTAFSAVN